MHTYSFLFFSNSLRFPKMSHKLVAQREDGGTLLTLLLLRLLLWQSSEALDVTQAREITVSHRSLP